MKSALKFLTLTAALLGLAGCASRRQAQPAFVPPPPPQAIVYPQGGPPYAVPGGPPAGAFPANPNPPGPGGPGPYPQPGAGGYPQPGPYSRPPQPPTSSAPFPTAPPTAPPASSSAPAPAAPDRVGYRWEGSAVPPPPTPAPSNTPAPQSPQPASPNVLLLPPVPESGSEQKQPEQKQEARRQPTSEPPPAQDFPVGIAGFDKKARENVAAGERPSLEGLDWLKNAGYRTIVFLHQPNQMTDADRKQVESRGMTFVAIEINPRDLNRDAVDRFLKAVSENPAEKKFVYDMDGSVSGAMWYLSFRLTDMSSDDTARARSGLLGQGENRESARDLWQAARKYVEQQR